MIGTPILNTYISASINAEKESRHSDILFLPGGLNAPPLLTSFSNPLRTKKKSHQFNYNYKCTAKQL